MAFLIQADNALLAIHLNAKPAMSHLRIVLLVIQLQPYRSCKIISVLLDVTQVTSQLISSVENVLHLVPLAK